MKKMKLWIGLFQVKETKSSHQSFRGAAGAYVNALAFAEDKKKFVLAVEIALKKWGLPLVEYSKIGDYNKRIEKFEVATEIKEIAAGLKPSQVEFDTFYPWKDRKKNKP